VFILNRGEEGSETVCPGCDSVVISDLDSCPVCGTEILGKDQRGVKKSERAVSEKITNIYNLIYRAEELEIDTMKSYQLVSQAKGELKVGDIEEAKTLLDEAIEYIFRSIVTALEDDIRNDSEDFEDLDLVEKTQSLIHDLKGSEEVREEIEDLIGDMEELEKSLSEKGSQAGEDKEEVEKLEEGPKEIDDIQGEIEELSEVLEEKGEKDIEKLAEEALDEAKERLVDLRGSDLGLDNIKRSFRRASKAKKDAKYQEAKDIADEAIKAGDDLDEILELCDEAEKKLTELAEKGLIKDEKSYESELKRYRTATNIGVYGLVKKNLEDLIKELENLEKEPEEEGDRNIVVEVKGMIKDMKELHASIEKSGIELQMIERYFEEAIPNVKAKVKSKDYEEAFETLYEGKKDLLERLDGEIKDEIESLRERIDSSDIEGGENRVRMFIDEIERLWQSREYKAALELLLRASDLIRSLKESSSKTEREMLTLSQIIEDLQDLKFDLEKEKGMLSDAREMERIDEVKEKIGEIKKSLSSNLNDRIKREVEEAEERFEDVPHEKVSIVLDRLARAESGRRGDDLGKMSWYWEKYRDLFEDRDLFEGES